jgi:hypothetical protein
MNEFVHDLATKVAHQRASMIDRHLAIFLTEQGFTTDKWTVSAMKAELKRKGFEIMMEHHPYSESEVFTFKLCKVYAQTALNIPKTLVQYHSATSEA